MQSDTVPDKPVNLTGGYRDFHYYNRHSLKLYARDYRPAKDGGLPPLVCLPGLSRNSADFHNLALAFSRSETAPRRVVAFDLRGRGLSEHDKDWTRYDVRVEAADISEGLTALDISHADFLGTSRGGLIIMVLAATRPGCLGHVILNDIGPKIEEIGLLRIKTYLGSMTAFRTWEDVHHAFRGPMREGFPAITERDYEEFIYALFTDRDGRPKPLFDEALLTPLKEMDFGQKLPELWPQFAALKGNRVDVLRGENSDILSQATTDRMIEVHPKARVHTVHGQAHAPLTNAPSVVELITSLLSPTANEAAAKTDRNQRRGPQGA